MEGQRIYVEQVRSAIGSKPKHRGTLRALGLGRIGRVSALPDRAEIRGMVARVAHLVEVHEEDPSQQKPGSRKAGAQKVGPRKVGLDKAGPTERAEK
jgi:large subunit ribosomal protein L30